MNDDDGIAQAMGFANDEEKAKFECDARERAMLSGGARPRRGSGDFSIGSAVWPGTSKLLEEQGELIQVLGKLMATGGDTKHWSGDLRKMLAEELGDLYAALAFFMDYNLSDTEQRDVAERAQYKLALFQTWQTKPTKP